jgi:hypothetical protein
MTKSERMKLQWQDEEYRKKMLLSFKNSPNRYHFKKGYTPWHKGLKGVIVREKMSKECKEKLSKSLKGRSVWNKDKKCPQLSGKNHWNWQGGVTSLYYLIRHLPENKEWTKKVFQKDNYTCQECSLRGVRLNAHHKDKPFNQLLKEFLQQYSQFSPIEDKETLLRLAITYEPFWNIDNGKTLCEKCHNKTKGGTRWPSKFPPAFTTPVL